ncbi:hypothetical protein DPMN_045602 [Dreissena polymorpha]|uniref:Uncharacterized protein n=1 Tax=Dreissena polymorpha TaxID=45954 RepID=A0A9D4D4N3_DREPO|nr:hypothetical protein DPMN_045602 [Dreissena polymorpha]
MWRIHTTSRQIPNRKQVPITSAETITQKECTETNTKVKRSLRADKRNCLAPLVTEAEEAAHKNRTKDLYSITKRITGK